MRIGITGHFCDSRRQCMCPWGCARALGTLAPGWGWSFSGIVGGGFVLFLIKGYMLNLCIIFHIN